MEHPTSPEVPAWDKHDSIMTNVHFAHAMGKVHGWRQYEANAGEYNELLVGLDDCLLIMMLSSLRLRTKPLRQKRPVARLSLSRCADLLVGERPKI